MSSTEFLHTAEFFETIFCFSLLVLIGQQFLLIWRQLDEKFMGMKVKEYNEEEQWLMKKMNVVVEASNVEKENKGREGHEKEAKPPKEETLRSSLVGNEHDQTDRKMYEENQEQTLKDTHRKSIDSDDNNNNNLNKRKSLTDLRKEQLKNEQQTEQEKQEEQKPEELREIEIKDESDATVSRKQSIDSQIMSNNNNNKRRSSELSSASAKLEKKLQEKQQELFNNNNKPNYKQEEDEPSVVNSNYSDHQNDEIRTEIKTCFKLEVLRQIDIVFGEHLAILMPLLILGIVVHSTYIFTIVCFFAYGFSHLLVNYTGNIGGVQDSLFSRSKLGKLIPKLCIVAIFISYWADKQFS